MPNVSTLTTEDPVLLVQLSDSHLFADADGSLLGLKTAQSLQQVIDWCVPSSRRLTACWPRAI